MKFIRITAKGDHVSVELVEDVLGRERVHRRSIYRTLDAARSAARVLSRMNGGCAIRELK